MDKDDLNKKLSGVTCPFCHNIVAMAWVDFGIYDDTFFRKGELSNYLRDVRINEKGMWTVVECPACHNCSLIKFKSGSKLEIEKIYPAVMPSPTNTKIKETIRMDIDEAKICLGANANKAAAIMARRALQKVCIDQGAPDTNLESQIDWLGEKGILPKAMVSLAHSIRWVGNDAAHVSLDEKEVTQEDASNIIELLEHIAYVLYVAPEISRKEDSKHKPTK